MKSFLRIILVTAWLAIFTAGCASSHTLVIADNNTAALGRDADGTPVLRSQLKHTVAVRPLTGKVSGDLRALPAFSVIVTNRGGVNVPFGAQDVAAFSGNISVAILDATTIDQRIARETVAADRSSPPLSEFRDATQAGEPTYAYGGTDSAQPFGNDGRRVMLRDQPGPAMQPLSMAPLPLPYHLLHEALLSQWIAPGQMGGGSVMLDPKDASAGEPLRIVVTFDGEAHTFWFVVK